jgi:hypothetical protein
MTEHYEEATFVECTDVPLFVKGAVERGRRRLCCVNEQGPGDWAPIACFQALFEGLRAEGSFLNNPRVFVK